MANSAVVGILRALLTADTAQFQAGLKGAAKEARAWQKDFNSIGQQATAAGRTLTTALTIPILGVGTAAVKSFIDFEDSFAGVRKTVDASEPEFAAMAKQFRELAKTIPINVNELNRLGEAAGALGIPKAQIVDFARVMAMVGVTTNVTSQQAAESIAKIQNIFGAAGQDTERFASTLVDLGNKGASTEQDILALALRIASAGNTVGLSQGKVLGFAAAIANVGMEAEAGGSAMSRIFIEISRAVSKGGDDLAGFARVAGQSSTEFAKAFRDDASAATVSFIEGLGRIKTGGGDLNKTLGDLGFTEIRQSDLLRRLAGDSHGLRTALDIQAKAWSDNTALATEAEKRFATTKSQLILLWNQVRDVGIELGGALMPALRGVMEAVKSLLPYIEGASKWFADLSPGMRTAIVAAFGLTAAIGPLLFSFGQMTTGAATLIGLFTKKGLAMRFLGAEALTATPLAAGFWKAVIGPVAIALAALAGLQLLGQEMSQLGGLSKEAAAELGKYDVKLSDFRRGNESGARLTAELNDQVKNLTTALIKQRTDALVPNLDLRGKAEALMAQQTKDLAIADERTRTLTEAQKQHNKEIKATIDQLSGAKLQKEMDDLAEAIKKMGGVISAGELAKLGPQLQQAADSGAKLDPVLERIRAQAETNAKGWAFFTQLIQANTRAREDSAKRVEALSDKEVKKITELTAAREKSLTEAQRTAREVEDAQMKSSLSATDYAIYQAKRLRDESLRAIEPLKGDITGAYDRIRAGILQRYDDMVEDARKTATSIASVFQQELSNLTEVLLGSIGRGDVGGAITSVVFRSGGPLANALGNGMASLAAKSGSNFVIGLSNGISRAIPGLGALLAPAINGLLNKIFGGNETKKGREQVAQMMGFRSLAEFYQVMGTMGEDGRRLVDEGLNKIGKNDTAALQRWTEEVKKLFETAKDKAREAAEETQRLTDELEGMKAELADLQAHSEPTWQDMLDAAKEFGIEIGGLGPLFQQQRLDAEATKIWNALDTLKRGGADMNVVLAGMTDELQAFVTESLHFKTTIPENLKPYLQALVDAGELVDENGEKLTDLSRLNFGEPVKSKWELIADSVDRLSKAISDLVLKLSEGLSGAIDDVKKKFGELPTEWEFDVTPRYNKGDIGGSNGVGDRVPGFKKGTGGEYVDFGAGTLAMLHGRERIIPEGELAGSGEPRLVEVPVYLDNAEIARAQLPFLVQALNSGGI